MQNQGIPQSQLSRAQLYDQLFLHQNLDVIPAGYRYNGSLQLFTVQLQPVLRRKAWIALQLLFYFFAAFFGVFHANFVAHLYGKIAHVDLASINIYVTVRDQLPRSLAGWCEIQFIYHVIQTPFQQLQQGRARITLGSLGRTETPHKLPLQQAVISLDFLLFPQPNGVFTSSASSPAVHSGRQVPLSFFDLALGRFTS